MLSFPKDNAMFSWTRHIKNKMVFYHLSGAQILRIFRNPERREEGIAEGTSAAMISRSPNSPFTKGRGPLAVRDFVSPPRPHEEIWIMYKMNKAPLSSRATTRDPSVRSRVTMISAWRYPGVTKPGDRPPIPPEIAEELEKGIY